jgi:hypothetical protein
MAQACNSRTWGVEAGWIMSSRPACAMLYGIQGDSVSKTPNKETVSII